MVVPGMDSVTDSARDYVFKARTMTKKKHHNAKAREHQRWKVLSVRLTDSEHKNFRLIAHTQRRTLSEWARDALYRKAGNAAYKGGE